MCYAALAASDLRELERDFAALIDVEEFRRVFWARVSEPKAYKFPSAYDRQFLAPRSDAEAAIAEAIDAHRRARTTEWETELFELRRRQADAQRKLAEKITKAAQKEIEVTTNKIEQRLRWLSELRETGSRESDRVVYSMNYAPVIVQTEEGPRVTPMRYHCRLPGHPPEMDRKLAGNYNARRDSLEKWWRPVFGRRHALFVLDGFRENVKRHDLEGRELRQDEKEENVVLQFKPNDRRQMYVPCVWSRWERDGQVLNSMALITDDPPEEVSRAGHDRCPINLTKEAALAWLTPQGRSTAELFEILAQRQRPIYQHQLAVAA